jgi:hypothetical protein
MAKKRPAAKSGSGDRSNEYMRGGKGRKDDVRGSRIYPIDAPNAPSTAEILGAGELGEGPRTRLPAKKPTMALAKREK